MSQEAASNFFNSSSSMILNMWIYTSATIAVAQIPLHIMAYITKNNGKGIDASKVILKNWTKPDKRQWFTLFDDLLYRYSLVVICFYWNLFTRPISLLNYTIRYQWEWYGFYVMLCLLPLFPIMPPAMILYQIYLTIFELFQDDWMSKSPAKTFYLKPPGVLQKFMTGCFQTQSMYVGQFLICGTNSNAINHSVNGPILIKEFWRDYFDMLNIKIPKVLVNWDGQNFEKTQGFENDNKMRKMFIKRNDMYCGIGDYVVDNDTIESTEKILRKDYPNMPCIVMEFAQPRQEYGVHSYDILTHLLPNGEVGVISCIMWADCIEQSSHSTQFGLSIDVDTGKIAEIVRHYSYAFTFKDEQREQKWLNMPELIGIRKSVEDAKKAHKLIAEKHEWLTTIGWDSMTDHENEITFFEGNIGGSRAPRMIFINWENMIHFIKYLYWPYDLAYSVYPDGDKSRDIVKVKTY